MVNKMRKIRIIEHISLDGVIEHGEDYAYGEWTVPYRNPDGLEAVIEAYGMGFDLLLGRRTYDLWASFWPNAGDHPIGNNLNAATKYIATHRPDSLEWGPVGELGADIIRSISDLKLTDGPDLVLSGSSTLTSVLFGQGLVDEVVLIVYPVLLGKGKRLFSDTKPCELALVSTKTTPTGVFINTYRHVGPLQTKASDVKG